MATEDCNRILDRDFAIAAAQPLIDLIVPELREAINYSLWALCRCGEAGEHDKEIYHTVPLLLFRHVVEMSDGIEVLLRQSCIVPAIPILRSSFEACLGLEYILKEDAERRALAWLCCYAHQQIELFERLYLSTSAGKNFDAVRKQELPTSQPADQSNVLRGIKNHEGLFAMPYMPPIEAEYQAHRATKTAGKQKRAPQWYSLFGGPNNLRELAARLGHKTEYDLLYGKWSSLAHGNDFGSFVSMAPEQCSFNSIRDPRELKIIGANAVKFILTALDLSVLRYRSNELGHKKWLAAIQSRMNDFLNLEVEVVKVSRKP